MTTTDVESIANQLASTGVKDDDTLSILSFAGKGLKLNTKEDAKEIVEAMEQFKNLETLRMDGNTMGIEAALAIAEALGKHPEFKRALWSDMFTGRLKSEIPNVLKHLGSAMMSSGAHLVELNLSDNAFGPNGVEGFNHLLKSPVCYSLQELYLNNNGLGIVGGKMLAHSLIECHKASVTAGKPLSLRVFIAGRNRLENPGATALAEAFGLIGTLEHIAMPQNGINPPGISALADAFKANKQLRVINLNDNTFTAKGAESMSAVLPMLENLEVINFGDCLVRTEGALALSEALDKSSAKLREINLSGGEIRKAGGIAIAESIEDKACLEKLDLSANCFGEEGVEMITANMEAMNRLDALQSLSDDEGSDVDDDGDEVENSEEDEDDDDDKNEDSDATVLCIKDTMIEATASVTNFLQFPSAKKLLALGNAAPSLIQSEVENDTVNRNVENVVSVAIKVASVSSEKANVQSLVNKCFDLVMQSLLQSLTATGDNDDELRNNEVMLLTNTILVYLGLIKSEDKSVRPLVNISGVLITLEHAFRQRYFPKSVAEILSVFIGRPHPQLEGAKEAQGKLLRVLFQY